MGGEVEVHGHDGGAAAGEGADVGAFQRGAGGCLAANPVIGLPVGVNAADEFIVVDARTGAGDAVAAQFARRQVGDVDIQCHVFRQAVFHHPLHHDADDVHDGCKILQAGVVMVGGILRESQPRHAGDDCLHGGCDRA